MGLTRRTAIVMAGLAGTAVVLPGGAARAASTVNGPWLVSNGWGLLQVNRDDPDPPVPVYHRGRNFTPSPDGRQLAFVDGPDNTKPNLFLLDRVTGQVRQLTQQTTANRLYWPSYSPDGARIAVSYDDDLYLVDAATGAMSLAFARRPVGTPAWSPDGARIAFFMPDSAGMGAIHVLKLATGRVRKVLAAVTADEQLSYPVWTPDSQQLLFVTRRWAARDSEMIRNDLGVVNLDGTGLRRLTRRSNYFLSPVWSPDGRKLAVLGIPPENTEPDGGNILVFPADFSRSWWIPGDEYDDSERLSWPRTLT